MKMDILSKLLLDLSEGQGLTIAQIQDRFGVQERTVHRYLNDLHSEFKVVVEKEPGPGKSFRYHVRPETVPLVQRRSNLVLHGLSGSEIMLLSMGLAHLALGETSPFKAELSGLKEKLKLLRSGEAGDSGQRLPEQFILSAARSAKSQEIKRAILGNMLSALGRGRACKVRYQSAGSTEPKEYVIDPACIFDYDGGLYVFAQKRDGSHMIPFALERFSYIEPLREPALVPADFDPHAYLCKAFNLVVNDPLDGITLAVDRHQAPYLRERIWGDRQEITEQDDGGIILSFDTNGAREVLRWILSQGRHARVLGPSTLKRQIQEEIELMAETYQL